MLPSHAPPDFQNRSVLWNSVEKIEKSKNSQLEREIELAIPKELPPEQQIELVREYVNDNFVSVGMCADIFKRKEKQPPEQNLIEILQELSKPQKVNMQYRIYNPKKLAEQIQYLQDNKIFTIPELDETVNSVRDEYDNIRITLKEVEGRLKSFAELVKQAEIYRRHRELYKQYHSLSVNKADMFRIKNYTEIALYEAAEKHLKDNVNGSTFEVGKWKTDIATLTEQKNKLYSEMYKKRDELKIAESIQKSVDTALRRHTRKRNIEYER